MEELLDQYNKDAGSGKK